MNTHTPTTEQPAVRPPAATPPEAANDKDAAPARNNAARNERAHLEDLLDKALADTFPASDPVSGLTADAPVEHSGS